MVARAWKLSCVGDRTLNSRRCQGCWMDVEITMLTMMSSYLTVFDYKEYLSIMSNTVR